MANEIGLSQLTGAIPDVVRTMALKARYSAAVIQKRVLNVDGDVAGKGDRLSLSVMPALSVNNVGAGGSVTRQQLSLTAVELVVDKYKETTVDIEDLAIRQTALSILNEYTSAMGAALAAQQDADLAALYSDVTTNTQGSTTDPQPLDDSMVRLARLQLDKLKVPRENRCWLLSPDAHADLLSQARFSEAQSTGLARGLQVEGGDIAKLYGDPVYVSTEIVTTGSAKANLYCHKEAFGIGTQKNFKLVPLAKVQLSEAVTAAILYGIKTIRQNHAALVYSAVNNG